MIVIVIMLILVQLKGFFKMLIIKPIIKIYTKHLDKMVLEYAQIYHFDMGKDGKTSVNNEGDAFKHCLMQAELSFYLGQKIAKYIGDKHEENNPLNTDKEKNMDLWNNAEGRKIGKTLRKIKSFFNLENTYYEFGEKIMIKMNADELITDLNDERRYEE